MNNAATALLRVAVLAGGAVLGAFLARWIDEIMIAQSQPEVDYHKSRYAQGLTPISQPPSAEAPTIHTINTIQHEENES